MGKLVNESLNEGVRKDPEGFIRREIYQDLQSGDIRNEDDLKNAIDYYVNDPAINLSKMSVMRIAYDVWDAVMEEADDMFESLNENYNSTPVKTTEDLKRVLEGVSEMPLMVVVDNKTKFYLDAGEEQGYFVIREQEEAFEGFQGDGDERDGMSGFRGDVPRTRFGPEGTPMNYQAKCDIVKLMAEKMIESKGMDNQTLLEFAKSVLSVVTMPAPVKEGFETRQKMTGDKFSAWNIDFGSDIEVVATDDENEGTVSVMWVKGGEQSVAWKNAEGHWETGI